MRWCAVLLLAALVLAGATPEGSAQLFGSKKPKTPPQQRVPELLGILKADKDAHKRAEAAEELRQFDPKDFPEIVPALIEALQSDASTSVRIEAATGLGRLRPISVPAGQALEKAVASDSNLRVRIQAKASLIYYQMSGYHAPKKTESPQGPAMKASTAEPPLAAGSDQWWKHGQGDKAPSPPATTYKPLPSGPQVPVVTAPAPMSPPAPVQDPAPTQGPTLEVNPPALQPAPNWVPARPTEGQGPRLMPPE